MVVGASKKLKVSDKSDKREETDGEFVLSIEKLKEIQDELKKINEEATDKVTEIKQKYNEVSKPLYDKRNNLIKYVPNLWLTVFSIHPDLNSLLSEKDHEIFKHLSSLEVEDHQDVKSGYSITFNFNPNPYFEDTKIVKYFTFLGEGKTRVTNTPIRWKKGNEIFNGTSEETKGNERPPSDISFLSWSNESEQNGGQDENHYKIANIIKDDLWLNPLNYFNNEDSDEADEDEDEDEDESCDVENDSSDSDDSDDDQEYDDEEEE
ncbi:hypothetical protein TSUD_224980 [Trifolium subterraneum]|uniref:Uncharacterized protein n=1 Tax=Trifolium subterraneum TaxID=3900 RepID=A0A2Z6N9X7_TRISU|nr:hypothetical protein TSUD_224980 [Trifolium subterraneum]